MAAIDADSLTRPRAAAFAHLKYRPDIDGLRALAVVSVVIFHAFPTALRGGFIGVDIFFVISGFLITSIVAGDCDRHRFSYGAFYARRIKRIFPALIVVLIAALCLGWPVLVNDEFSSLGHHVVGSAAFFENFMLLKEPGYFDSKAEINPVLHLWSLGVEEQFYIVWPVVVGNVWRLRRSLAFAVILAIALASLAISEFWVFAHPMSAFYSPISRFWELLAGGFVAIFLSDQRVGVRSAPARNIGSGVGIGLIGIGLVAISQHTRFPGLWAAFPVFGTCLLIWAGGASWLNRTILSNRYAVWIGLISYPLYLWHWVLLAYARLVVPTFLTIPARLSILGVSVLLAWATYRFVEKPLRTGRIRVVAVPALCAGMIAITGMGYAAERFMPPRLSHTALNAAESTRARDSDGSCAKLLGLPPTPEEVCQTRSNRPEVLIAGDSHAMALNASILLGRTKINALMIAGHSCRLLPSITQTPDVRQSWGNNCDAITRDVLKAASLSSIKTIIITTHAPLWEVAAGASREPWAPSLHGDYSFRDAAGRALSDKQADIEGYRSLAAMLLATGKRLVFVIDVPGLTIDPHGCVARLPFLEARSCDLPRSEIALRQRAYRAFVDQLAVEFPAMMIFDATKALCSDTICAAGDADGFYYFDTHHLSEHGSDRVLAALIARLDAHPEPIR